MSIFKRFKQGDKENADELGFGNKYSTDSYRMINKDGTFNVHREGGYRHLYYELIEMSWWKFITLVFLFYFVLNTLFALGYLLIGVDQIAEAETHTPMHQFFSAFFLSAQTLTTVGFGYFRPTGIAANFFASFEAFFGLLSFALATGLLYGRFSKPEAGLMFTPFCIIAPYKNEMNSLQFRLANKYDSNLIELEARMVFSMIEEQNGVLKRSFYPLELEMSEIYYLSLNWTIVHLIKEDSPLYGKTAADLHAGKAEIMVMIKAFNETFSQVVHERTSYKSDEIHWNKKFLLPYTVKKGGATIFNLEELAKTEDM